MNGAEIARSQRARVAPLFSFSRGRLLWNNLTRVCSLPVLFRSSTFRRSRTIARRSVALRRGKIISPLRFMPTGVETKAIAPPSPRARAETRVLFQRSLSRTAFAHIHFRLRNFFLHATRRLPCAGSNG